MNAIRWERPRRRSGITWIEVLVLLCALTILCALIAPAMLHSKRPARKLECLNNMRQVGVAMQNFASATGGQLPLLGSTMPVRTDEGQALDMLIGWPITLFPALDATAVLMNIKRNAVPGRSPQTTMTIADTEKIWMPVFTCPQDPDSYRKPGGLSFVVNSGFIPRSLYYGDPDGLHRPGLLSWDGNDVSDEEDDIQVGAATGVIWRSVESFPPSLDYISTGDGTSQTLMLTENLQAGNWFDIDTTRISFGLPVTTKGIQVPLGSGTWFESLEHPLNTLFTGGTLATATPQDWQINRDLNAPTGTRPRPSSNHNGGVNVIMCDGSGRFINDQIDPHVYVKLLTSNGVSYGEGKLDTSAY